MPRFVCLPALAIGSVVIIIASLWILRRPAQFQAAPLNNVPGPSTATESDFLSKSKALPPHAPAAIHDFNIWLDRYCAASAAEKRQLENAGSALAQSRHVILENLIKTDPETALKSAIPFAKRRQLPELILNQLEQRVSGRGDFWVRAASPFPGREADCQPISRQAEIEGRLYNVYSYGSRLSQTSQRGISLYGIAIGQTMALGDSPLRVLEAGELPTPGKTLADTRCPISGKETGAGADAAGRDPTVVVESGTRVYRLCSGQHLQALEKSMRAEEASFASISNQNIGSKRMLVMRVDFTDQPGATVSDDECARLMNDVNGFVRANSFNQLSFDTLDISPLLRMPQPSYYYSRQDLAWQILADARKAADDLGYDSASYDFDVVTFTYIGFPWSGIANLGSKGALVQDYFFRSFLTAHELGHNFGNGHANLWSAPADSIIGPGSNIEYGNPFDVMGGAHTLAGHYNANFKYVAGWLTDANVQIVTTSGTYRLYAIDSGGALHPDRAYALKFPVQVFLNGMLADYWVDFRQQHTNNAWAVNGAIIKWGTDTGSMRGNQLLDFSPGSPDGADDSPLLIGHTFADSQRGVYITPLGKGGAFPETYLDLAINIGQSSNSRPVLTLTASPATAAVGGSVSLTAVASDPDGDALAYGWDFGDRSVVEGSLNRSNVTKSWLSDGEYNVRCTVSDMRGGESSRSIIVRVGNPTIYQVSGSIIGDAAAIEGVRVHNGLAGANYRATWTESDGTYRLPGVAPGLYTLSAVKNGFVYSPGFSNPLSVGSSNVTGANFQALPKSSVFVSSFTPTNAQVGSTVLIQGNGFFNVTNLSFGDISAAFAVRSASQISAVVPEGAVSGPITILFLAGSASSPNDFLVQPSPPIITPIGNQAVIIGSNITFTAKTSGSGPLGYQWQKEGVDIPGAINSTYAIFLAETNDAGIYRVTVRNPVGIQTSPGFALAVIAPISYGEALDTTNFVWNTSLNHPWLTETNVTRDGVDAIQSGDLLAGEQSWIETTTLDQGRLSFWWKVSSGSGSSADWLQFWIGEDIKAEIAGEVDWNEVSFFVPEGQKIRWRYSKNSLSMVGQNRAWVDQLSFVHSDGPPVLLRQPTNQHLFEGETATFSISAAGPGPLSYTWFGPAGAIPGATNDSLQIARVRFADQGIYYVTITNRFGRANSAHASLAISALRPPYISLNQPYPGEATDLQLEASPVTYNGPVHDIAFYDGSRNVGLITNAPWTMLWSNIDWGDHVITAVVRDTRGGVATSAPVSVRILGLLSKGSVWKYLDDGSDAGSDWRHPTFDDAEWSFGPAPLGYGHDSATVVGFGPNPTNKFITTYFRRRLEIRNVAAITNLTARIRRDDGAVVYVNGVEAFRSNMPEGPVGYMTLAASPSYYEDEGFFNYGILPALLVEGTNVIAVEVHQISPQSSGLGFDFGLIANLLQSTPSVVIRSPSADQVLNSDTIAIETEATDADGNVVLVEFFESDRKIGEDASLPFSFIWSNILSGEYAIRAVCTDNTGLKGTSAPISLRLTATLVSPSSVWKYLDNGSDQGTQWQSVQFGDSLWPSGRAELGYGNHPRTIVSFGPDPTNKYVTTYFRKTFSVPDPAIFSNLTLSIKADDAAVVYLNGTEVLRKNMPEGPIDYQTLAASPIEDDAASYGRRWVNPAFLIQGNNVLAVEVHQSDRASPDLSFDLSLVGNLPIEPPAISFGSPNALSFVYDTEEDEWVGRFFVEGDVCTVCAEASDPDGDVARVELFADGVRLAEFTQPPYCITWSNLTACTHVLTARAVDNSGAISSALREVTVISASQFTHLIRPRSWPWLFRAGDPQLGDRWRASNLKEEGWQTGYGMFGNLSGDTFVDSAGTTLFRYHFDLGDPAAFTNLLINFYPYFGEGAVFYLNGAEVFRMNMPTGQVTLATPAISAAAISNSTNADALQAGDNILAVEVHHPWPDTGATEFDFSVDGQRANVPRELLPCFEMNKIAPDYAYISWGDVDLWYLEAAENLSGPWRPVSFHGSYDIYLFNAGQQFFRLHAR